MVRQVVTYTVPLKGNILDWESFTGDGSVGASIIPDLVSSWDTTSISDADREVITYLKSIDIDAGTCTVDVEAHLAFHGVIQSAFLGKTVNQLAVDYGITVLKLPSNTPRPKKNLVFNTDITIVSV